MVVTSDWICFDAILPYRNFVVVPLISLVFVWDHLGEHGERFKNKSSIRSVPASTKSWIS